MYSATVASWIGQGEDSGQYLTIDISKMQVVVFLLLSTVFLALPEW